MDFFAGPLCDFNWVIKSSSTDCFGLVAVQLWYFFPPDPDDQYLIKDGVSKNRGSECAPQRNGPKPKLIEFPTRKRPDKSSDLSRAHFFITCYGGPACGHRYLNCLFGKWFFFFRSSSSVFWLVRSRRLWRPLINLHAPERRKKLDLLSAKLRQQ